MFRRFKIGFLLTPGCQMADIIGIDAVLGSHPRNRVYYISEGESIVYEQSNMGLKATATFKNCPAMDILVVGEMRADKAGDEALLEFVAHQSKGAKFIIGVSNGVEVLYNAGVISNQTVTADRTTLNHLKGSSLSLINERRCVIDGKFITAGPSTGAIEAAFSVLKETRGEWLTKFLEFNLEYDARIQYPLVHEVIVQQPELPKALKVGVLAVDGLYLPDIMGAAHVFGKIPNAELLFVGKEKGLASSILGMGPTVVASTTMAECPPLDVLIIGASHPKYISDKEVQDFITEQEKSAKAMIGVCAGTFLLGSTGLLNDKEAATNYHQTRDLKMIGAKYSGKEVEVDGKFLSAGPAVGSYEVGLKAVEKTVGREWAQYIEHEVLEFCPNPVYGINQHNVPRSILTITNIMSVVLRAFYRPDIKKAYCGNKSNKT